MISRSLTKRLKDPSLLRCAGLVAGIWRDQSTTGKTFEVANPATGETIAVLPDMGAPETEEAIVAASCAQSEWAAHTGKERAVVLRRLHDLMVTNADDLATVITAEMGKPWAEARGEVLYGASYIEWFGEEVSRCP